jgi:drug/metabolite transporter (DMT)-like permease
MTPSDPRAALWMLWGALCFAAMAAMTHALGSRCDWVQVALVRALFMYVSILLVAGVTRVRLVLWRPPTLWVRSLAGTFSLFCSFYALSRLPVAEVLTLTNTYPIWIVLMSWGAFGQRPAPRDLAAVTCGVLGVALIERPRFGHDHVAALVALVSSLCAAVAMLGLHRLRDLDPRAVVAHFAGVATAMTAAVLLSRSAAVPLAGSSAMVLQSPPLDTLLLLGGVGLTGTVGQVFLTKAYAAGMPSEVAVISLTQVIFGLLLDLAFWGRALSPIALVGMVLILAPTAWINLRDRDRDRDRDRPGHPARPPV